MSGSGYVTVMSFQELDCAQCCQITARMPAANAAVQCCFQALAFRQSSVLNIAIILYLFLERSNRCET